MYLRTEPSGRARGTGSAIATTTRRRPRARAGARAWSPSARRRSRRRSLRLHGDLTAEPERLDELDVVAGSDFPWSYHLSGACRRAGPCSALLLRPVGAEDRLARHLAAADASRCPRRATRAWSKRLAVVLVDRLDQASSCHARRPTLEPLIHAAARSLLRRRTASASSRSCTPRCARRPRVRKRLADLGVPSAARHVVERDRDVDMVDRAVGQVWIARSASERPRKSQCHRWRRWRWPRRKAAPRRSPP